MDPQRLATLFDYETYAREILDIQTFEHLQGQAALRPPENISDYDLIKLRHHGMFKVATLKNLNTSLLGGKVQMQSPICVGPLPALSDVKLSLNGDSVHPGAAIKSVCD